MLTPKDLHPYQQRAIDFIWKVKRCALFMDVGLGKTSSALSALVDLIDFGLVKKTIIVAPLRVAKFTWGAECAKWSHLNHLDIGVITGEVKLKERIEILINSPVIAMNPNMVGWMYNYLLSKAGRKQKIRIDMLILDESSLFKNPSTQRFKILKKIPSKYTVLLTGTPCSNSIMDLWAQIFLLDGGKRLGTAHGHFKNKYFYKVNSDEDFGIYTPFKDSVKNITGKISDICLTLEAKDYLDLPEVINITKEISLTKPQIAEYKYLSTELIWKHITLTTAASVVAKQMQYCNGFLYETDKVTQIRTTYHIHNEKIEAMKEIVEENPNETLFVAYYYEEDLIRLCKAFPRAVVLGKDIKVVDDWNAGKIKILLAHMESAGHGLNLQYGGSIVVWYSLTYSLELYLQFNGRINRQGQTKVVRIIHIKTDNTVEDDIVAALIKKDENQLTVKRLLK